MKILQIQIYSETNVFDNKTKKIITLFLSIHIVKNLQQVAQLVGGKGREDKFRWKHIS